jgi:hypothetical protein
VTRKNSFFAKVAAAGLVLVAQQAGAALVSTTYYLTLSNTNPPFPNNVAYATVTLDGDDTTAGAVTVTVDVDQSLFTTGPNFGIQAFAFNQDSAINPTFATADVTGLPSGWTANVPPSGNSDGFGLFDAQVDTGGTARQDPLTFTVADTTVPAFATGSDKGHFFALHITDVCDPASASGECLPFDGITSFWVAGNETFPPSEVPVPAAVWLFGSGLLGLVGIGRRSRKS